MDETSLKYRQEKRTQDNYSRPLKEDLIWMRKGEHNRMTSTQDFQTDIFLRNIRSGRFFDGSDPVASREMQLPYFLTKDFLVKMFDVDSSANTDEKETINSNEAQPRQ